mmetsp:Transcript_55541/g.50007  ORF Transcript_55541/g.50007 Transcript_55541/m.50007 type:complete len:85 (-) Transcript_55541:149-403(-)
MKIHLDGDIFMLKCKRKEFVKQKKRGELPDNYPENEEQLNRMDPQTFEAMMPKVEKIRFDVDVDRMDGVCGLRNPLPSDHGHAK